jgi:hypothetical protein
MSNGYDWIQSEKIDNWYVMSGISKHSSDGSWCAWAKRTAMVSRDGPLYEPGEVHAEFGESRKEAISNLFKNDLYNSDA